MLDESRAEGVALPNVEDPSAPLRAWSDNPAPSVPAPLPAGSLFYADDMLTKPQNPSAPDPDDVQFNAGLETGLALHTVCIEPDANRVSLTWGASAALPAALENFPGSEAELFSSETGIDIDVDGHRYVHGPGARAA